eukprot:528433-Amphidinium_carterae.1
MPLYAVLFFFLPLPVLPGCNAVCAAALLAADAAVVPDAVDDDDAAAVVPDADDADDAAAV